MSSRALAGWLAGGQHPFSCRRNILQLALVTAVVHVTAGGSATAASASGHMVPNNEFAAAADPHVFDVTAYGAKGDGETDDTRAVEMAYAACASAGGGTVVFPQGRTFRTVRCVALLALAVCCAHRRKACPDHAVLKHLRAMDIESCFVAWLWSRVEHVFVLITSACLHSSRCLRVEYVFVLRPSYPPTHPPTLLSLPLTDPQPRAHSGTAHALVQRLGHIHCRWLDDHGDQRHVDVATRARLSGTVARADSTPGRTSAPRGVSASFLATAF
jgi:hypothetical protein